jgi:uncharacterized protein
MFIGREKELERLNGLKKKNIASFVVIKGRRRIGKSRLIEKFSENTRTIALSGLPPDPKINAQDQRDEFARQLGRIFQIPIPYSQDWGDLFWHLAHHTQKGAVVISLDEISWMGMKDRTFLGKLKTAWDQLFKKNPELILIVCGSVSSWIERNILSSTGFVGRIDLVITLEELSLPYCNQFWGKQAKNISAYEKFKVLSVTGGVPRYLENIVPSIPAEEWIRQLCFTPEGFLFREFEQIFHDLFSSKNETYRKILEYLGQSPNGSLEEICGGIGIEKSGVISKYMQDLAAAGFLRRSYAWELKTAKSSKISKFRISDNYIRFYLKYIAPKKESILRGAYQDRPLGLISGWEGVMELQFENLVIQNRSILYRMLGIHPSEILCDGPYFQRATKQKAGCQIDYLIQTKYNTLYVCEIRFLKNRVQADVIAEMEQKIAHLDVQEKMSIRPVLIHVNGVSEDVIAEAFFAEIIDFGRMLIEP